MNFNLRKHFRKFLFEELRSNVPSSHLDRVPVGNWVDQRIKVESWQIRILSFDEHNIRSVVPKMKRKVSQGSLSLAQPKRQLLFPPSCVSALSPGEVDMVRKVVVQVRKSNLVFSADRLPDDDLVNIIEFIPIFVPRIQNQR